MAVFFCILYCGQLIIYWLMGQVWNGCGGAAATEGSLVMRGIT